MSDDALGMRSDLAKAYDPSAIEEKWAAYWVKERLFDTPVESVGTKAFTMLLPPPNVTGRLHMGHMLNQTEMDILTRWHRMLGERALWVPGTDHAGIATQMMVEKQLAAEGKTSRVELGREAFTERVWAWKQQYGGAITDQMRRLGASVDWTREYFTMDEDLSDAVVEAFVRLWEQGLVYRGAYIVNWDPAIGTAVSDLEVVHEERVGKLYFVRYPLAEGEGSIVIATTRPETMLGDVAVVVNPADERYTALVGKQVRLPLSAVAGSAERVIPILADEWAQPEFGTGAVKVTPAHDPNDFAIGQRHGLASPSIFDAQARVSLAGSKYDGMDRYAAREAIVADLDALGLLVEVKDHGMSVGLSQRSGSVIEPRLSDQWFIRIQPLADKAIAAVKDGHIRFTPEMYEKTYFEWMGNIHDWCISRQLWWGHRIPAWHCAEGHITVARTTPSACGTCGSGELRQETDVLDTWFSSGLLPFTVFGWPGSAEAGSPASRKNDSEEATADSSASLRNDNKGATADSSASLRNANKEATADSSASLRNDNKEATADSSASLRNDNKGATAGSLALLGDERGDLAAFYPTDVLVTGFDILFFWVARMIMLGTHFMLDVPMADGSARTLAEAVPFREVYIHALVRDADRQKMSKTKGNVIDPISIIERFGTDAVRFTLASMASPGTDIAFSEARTEGNRAFANKIWNAARFLFMNVERGREAGCSVALRGTHVSDARPSPQRASAPAGDPEHGAPGVVPLETLWVYSRLSAVAAEVERALAAYRFDEAAGAVYQFFWGEFCDWYLELVKVRLEFGKGQDEVARLTLAALVEVYEAALRLLSPFMPFLTEEIWHALYAAIGEEAPAKSIALTRFPLAGDFARDVAAEEAMASLQELIVTVRALRKEMGVPEKEAAPVLVASGDQAVVELAIANADMLAKMARVSSVAASSEALSGSGSKSTARFDVRVVYERVVDVAAERERLTKELAKFEKGLMASEKQLGNEAFMAKAPAHIVDGLKKQAAETGLLYEKAKAALAELGG